MVLGPAVFFALDEVGVGDVDTLVGTTVGVIVLGLVMTFWSLCAWAAPRERRGRRRKAEAERIAPPLRTGELTHRALAGTALDRAGRDAEGVPAARTVPDRPDAEDWPPVRWYSADLLRALGVHAFAASALSAGAGAALFLVRGDGSPFTGLFLLAATGAGVMAARRAIIARGFARIASGQAARPMRYVLLRHLGDRADRLVLFPPGDDPDAAPEAVLRLGRARNRGLPPVGVAHVHRGSRTGVSVASGTEGSTLTVLVPRIGGVPVWPDEAAFLLDLSRSRDRALLAPLVREARDAG